MTRNTVFHGNEYLWYEENQYSWKSSSKFYTFSFEKHVQNKPLSLLKRGWDWSEFTWLEFYCFGRPVSYFKKTWPTKHDLWGCTKCPETDIFILLHISWAIKTKCVIQKIFEQWTTVLSLIGFYMYYRHSFF